MSVTLDDYQQKLETFISVVPVTKSPTMINQRKGIEYYGEVHSGTPALSRGKFGTPEEKEAYKKLVDAASVGNNDTFTTLTGLTHRQLLDNWKTGGQLTSCNGFVGKAGAAMGAKGLGGFYVEEMLRGINKAHCWITPASGLLPRFGDVFESRSSTPGQDYLNIHVGVSLRLEGTKWYTIEGGQGGPASGVDKVARAVRTYDVGHLLGWVDMKLYVSASPPLPDWLIGTWIIYAADQKYVYRIDRYGDVTQHVFLGLGNMTESATVLDTGKLTLGVGDAVEVQWKREGWIEKLTYDRWNSFPGIIERLTGVAADGTPMRGVRL